MIVHVIDFFKKNLNLKNIILSKGMMFQSQDIVIFIKTFQRFFLLLHFSCIDLVPVGKF